MPEQLCLLRGQLYARQHLEPALLCDTNFNKQIPESDVERLMLPVVPERQAFKKVHGVFLPQS